MSVKTYQKGGIIIPIEDFIMSLFNLKPAQICQLEIKRENNDTINAYIITNPSDNECPVCGAHLISHGHSRPKVITHALLAQHKCYIHWTPMRFKCSDSNCGKTITESNPFTFPGFQISYATIRQIMLDLRKTHMSFKDIAEKNDVSITQVQRYFDSYVHVPRPQSLPENLGIDEMHSDMAKYGSSYLCVLVDNEKRQIFDILPSRSKRELIKYFEQFSIEARNKVRFVTMDMWDPYRDVARRMFKNCEIAADSFHVVEHLIKSFSSLRLSIMHQVEYNSTSYYLLKKWSWLLTANSIELDNKKTFNHVFNRYMNHHDFLNEILAINDDLLVAYNLMKLYQTFNKECPPEEAHSQLNMIIESFTSADIPCYREFLVTLNNWKDEIANSFHRPLGIKQTNSFTENINSQIRTYLAIAKGTSNFERFRRRIMYCLNDNIFYSTTSFLTSLKRDGKKRGTYNK